MKKILLTFIVLFLPISVSASVIFNGTDQYLKATSVDFGLNGGTEFSACIWEQVNGPTGSQILVSKISDSTNQWATFRLQPNSSGGNVSFSVQNQAKNEFPNWASSGGKITDGWHHFCGTFKVNAGDSTDGKIYIDGVSRAVTFTANGYAADFTLEENSNDFTIGARTFSPVDNYYKGTAGDVAVWNKQLTAGEVTTQYNNGRPRPCERISSSVQASNLKAYFPLDDIASGIVSTTPTNLGSVTVNLSAVGSPVWSTLLTCVPGAQINSDFKVNSDLKIY